MNPKTLVTAAVVTLAFLMAAAPSAAADHLDPVEDFIHSIDTKAEHLLGGCLIRFDSHPDCVVPGPA